MLVGLGLQALYPAMPHVWAKSILLIGALLLVLAYFMPQEKKPRKPELVLDYIPRGLDCTGFFIRNSGEVDGWVSDIVSEGKESYGLKWEVPGVCIKPGDSVEADFQVTESADGREHSLGGYKGGRIGQFFKDAKINDTESVNISIEFRNLEGKKFKRSFRLTQHFVTDEFSCVPV
jgi:hypothetical protein